MAVTVYGGYRLPQATRKVPAKPAVESKNPTLLCSRVGFLIKMFLFFYCLLDRDSSMQRQIVSVPCDI